MPKGWVGRGLANDRLNDANVGFDRPTFGLLHPNPLAIVVLADGDDLRRGFVSADELLNLYDHFTGSGPVQVSGHNWTKTCERYFEP